MLNLYINESLKGTVTQENYRSIVTNPQELRKYISPKQISDSDLGNINTYYLRKYLWKYMPIEELYDDDFSMMDQEDIRDLMVVHPEHEEYLTTMWLNNRNLSGMNKEDLRELIEIHPKYEEYLTKKWLGNLSFFRIDKEGLRKLVEIYPKHKEYLQDMWLDELSFSQMNEGNLRELIEIFPEHEEYLTKSWLDNRSFFKMDEKEIGKLMEKYPEHEEYLGRMWLEENTTDEEKYYPIGTYKRDSNGRWIPDLDATKEMFISQFYNAEMAKNAFELIFKRFNIKPEDTHITSS